MNKQLEIGIKIESEHKETVSFIREYFKQHGSIPPAKMIYEHIAKNHLKEFPDEYYSELIKMENKLKGKPMKKAFLKIHDALFLAIENMDKARGPKADHKYYKRIPNPKGKGWIYFYTIDEWKQYQKNNTLPGSGLLSGILNFFKFNNESEAKQKIKDDYQQGEIKTKFGITVSDWINHVSEYFNHKQKWDLFFQKKQNEQKQNEKNEKNAKNATYNDKKIKSESKKIGFNSKVMYYIYTYYKEDNTNGRNQNRTGQGKLSANTQAVQKSGIDRYSLPNVQERKPADNKSQSGIASGVSGNRPGRDVRLTKGQIKATRKEILDLLASKTDDEMTAEDKELLRQYEGAGGLDEQDKSVSGTLYEYYTPRNVINKIWQLVNKYVGNGSKDVLEPSAGIGRFAENQNHNFTMLEIDPVSARINKILFPDANISNKPFQELFMKGNIPVKNYTGKKFDIVVGNPPYGAYAGLHKGLGEGKEHTTYQEYFIDRGLDTLKDGGIMAFIVPSTFLRDNQYSTAKSQIASKGKLLEAYRLPNGTFSTTGVGTDIIILRKEKGNINDFLDDKYFQNNPNHILGDATTRTGRFGKPEQYVSLKPGDTFDSVISNIDTLAVPVVPINGHNIDAETKAKISMALKDNKNAEKLTHKEKKKTEKKDKKNISIQEKENETVQSGPKETDTLAQFNSKYNKHYNETELNIWKNTGYSGIIDTGKLSKKEMDYLKQNENICIDEGNNFVHKVNYASGNIYQKLRNLEAIKENLSPDKYESQKKLLESVLPEFKTVKNFFVSPISDFAKHYLFDTDKEVDTNAELPENSLIKKFFEWATGSRYNFYRQNWGGGVTEHDLPSGLEWSDIIDYVFQKPVSASRRGDSSNNKFIKEKKQELRRDVTEKLFKRFIETGLNKAEQTQLEKDYNEKFNSYVAPDYSKIPLFVDGISKTFKGKQLVIKEKQMQGASFLCNKGNGLLAHDVGVGKAQPLDAKILTPNGWAYMGDLKAGDYVISDDGKKSKVLNIYPQGTRDVFRISFSDNSYTECCEDHLWNLQKPGNRNKSQTKNKNIWKTIALKDFMEELYNSRGEKIFSIPIVKPINFDERHIKIHPYLLGVLLGDGSIANKTTSFSSMDNEIINKVKSLLPNDVMLKKINKCDYRITSGPNLITDSKNGRFLPKNSIKQALKHYKLSGCKSNNKFIPDDYKYNSIENRIQLLHGLMDTDGYVSKNGHTVQFCTVSKQLSNDMTELIQSFGGTVSKNEKYPIFYYKGEKKEGQKSFVLTIKLPKQINPFFLKRKRIKIKPKEKYFPVRYISDVSYVGKKETQCILIENNSHLYVTNDFIVTHNTMTGIVATVNQLQTGRAKRPVICVPKAVYSNWIKEIKDMFPDIKINELGNLGKDYVNANLAIAPGTLSVMTYQALQKLTFKNETIHGDLIEDMLDSQQWEKEKMSDRDRAQMKQKIYEKLGMAIATNSAVVDRNNFDTMPDDEDAEKPEEIDDDEEIVEGTSHYLEDLGFDHITVDETHNFKNVFGAVKTAMQKGEKGKNKRVANEFRNLSGGQSLRALKMFAVTQVIQKNNNDRNVFALTATPFTNSPIEIYNILSLVARKKLKELNIYNLHEFMAQFAKLKSEWAVKANGNVERKSVMKEFQNLSALQNLIREYIDKVDGEEAGVVRPVKHTHLVDLNMTRTQKKIYEIEQKRFDLRDDSGRPVPGATLKAINNMRMATISPSLVEFDELYDGSGIPELVKEEHFINDSPKLKFTFDSVSDFYKQQKQMGQVVYMPRGVKSFSTAVNYLVQQGIPKKAIATISGKTSNDAKEKIMQSFNDPDGEIKIVIGSDTIKEGVNLNGNSAALYNIMLGWNPSETTQVEGRIWRQGNKQGYTHIVYPQLIDSVDSAMYQKHDEKRQRFEAIWSYKGDALNVEDINPEELKFELIKDPVRRAKFQMDLKLEAIEDAKRDKRIFIDMLTKFKNDFDSFENDIKYNIDKIPQYEKDVKEAENDLEKAENDLKEYKAKTSKKEPDYQYKINDLEREVRWAKDKVASEKKYLREAISDIKKNELEKTGIQEKLNGMGGLNIEKITDRIAIENNEIKKLVDEEHDIKDNKERYIKQAEEELKRNKKEAAPVNQTVDEHVKLLLGNLKSMEAVKPELDEITKKTGRKVFNKVFNPKTKKFDYYALQ